MMLKFIEISAILLILASCRNESGTVVWKDEIRMVTGKLAFAKGQGPLTTNFSMYIIDENGGKVPVKNFKISGERFEFILEKDHYLYPPFITMADRIVSMGNSKIFPEPEKRFPRKFRLIIVDDNFKADNGRTQIIHEVTPITRNDLLGTERQLSYSSEFKAQTVGYQKIIVRDQDGEPLSSSYLLGFMAGKSTGPDNRSIPSWMRDLYRPIIHKTDEEGTGYIFPLDLSNDKASYILIAWASGYCTWVSPPLPVLFAEEAKEKTRSITLKKCENAGDQAAGLIMEYAPQTTIYQENIENSQNTRPVAYFNGLSYNIRIDSLSPFIKPLTIRFRESFAKNGPRNQDIKDLDLKSNLHYLYPFQSNLHLSLPDRFSMTADGNGSFNLIAGLKSDSQEEQNESQLFGRKKISSPSVSFMEDLKVRGLNKHGIISGNGPLFIESSYCKKDMEFGIKFTDKIVFSPCLNQVAQFNAKSLGIPGKDIQIGGLIRARIFIKDKFKNISKDDLLNENEVELFVDYSAPDPKTYPLIPGGDFSFSFEEGQQGETFPISEKGVPVIANEFLNSISFHFTSASRCRTKGGDTGDGILLGDQGLLISQIALSAEKPIAFDTQDSTRPEQMIEKEQIQALKFTDCAKDGIAIKRPLEPFSIHFPDDPEKDASYWLTLQDAAGNISKPVQYQIRPCSQAKPMAGDLWCWQKP